LTGKGFNNERGGELCGGAMKKTKLTTSMPEQEAEMFINRIEYCLSMLWLHGFMSDGEHDKIRVRIKKELDRQGLVRRPITTIK